MMGKRVAGAVLMLLAARILSVGREEPVDGYAALVNDRVITVGDVLAFLQPVEDQLRTQYSGEELDGKLRAAYRNALDSLIERALILEEFESEGAQVPDRFVDDHAEAIVRERFGGDRAAFLRALAEERLTLNEWREQVKEQLIVMLMRKREVLDRVFVSPEAAREAYAARLDRYTVPERVRLRMIVLHKGETEEAAAVKRQQALDVLARLRAGADFAETAAGVSEGGKADRGGDWGWVDPTTLRPELAEAVARLASGQLSEVIETEDAFYIVKIEARQERTVIPFEQARRELEDELRRQEEDRLYRAWIDRLRAKYYVKVFPLEGE